jgi:hypothetical protein
MKIDGFAESCGNTSLRGDQPETPADISRATAGPDARAGNDSAHFNAGVVSFGAD